MTSHRVTSPFLTLLALALAGLLGWYAGKSMFLPPASSPPIPFDGERALRDVAYQVALGPRTPGSAAHARVVAWIQGELERAGWQSEVQEVEILGRRVQNIVAYRSGEPAQIILAAHYDSRLRADRDPEPSRRADPVPGANDGASGVAVLLELARTLPQDIPPVHLVFFDAEDNGNLPGWDWILGSRAFVQRLETPPRAAIVIDMIGDADLNLYYEQNSDPILRAQVWQQAAALGYDRYFIPSPKYRILDDHIPFLRAGIPAIDIIDVDYPYWHTTADTPDKLSAGSLDVIGSTLWAWLTNWQPGP